MPSGHRRRGGLPFIELDAGAPDREPAQYEDVMDATNRHGQKKGPGPENPEHTQFFQIRQDEESAVRKVLEVVYEALSTKGYDPVNQIVGYIMSGDPTYITNYMGARSLIMKVERDELVEEILECYIRSNNWK